MDDGIYTVSDVEGKATLEVVTRNSFEYERSRTNMLPDGTAVLSSDLQLMHGRKGGGKSQYRSSVHGEVVSKER